MMNGHSNAFSLPEGKVTSFNIPLLEDGFDAGGEEIFEHNDMFALHTNSIEEDFSL